MRVAASTVRAQGAPCSQAPRRAARAPQMVVPAQLAAAAGWLANAALAAPAAKADEAGAGLSAVSLPSISAPPVDVSDVAGQLGGIDPLYLGGAVVALVVPAAIIAFAGGSGGGGAKVKGVTAAKAVEALQADQYCLLLDIRSRADVKEEGAPKGVNRRGVVTIPFTTVVDGKTVADPDFGAKVARTKGLEKGGPPVILLDSSGQQAQAAAKAILAEAEVDALYYVQGGADAWRKAGGPWRAPGSGLSLSLPSLNIPALDNASRTVVKTLGAIPDVVSDPDSAPAATRGLLIGGAVLGAAALLFNNVELLFEIAGLVGVAQFILSNLDAQDREKTFTTVKRVVDQVDLGDLPEDLGKAINTLLEDPSEKTGTTMKRAGVSAAKPPVADKKPAPPPPAVPVSAAANGSGEDASASSSSSAPTESGGSQ